jgi:hypothetical protein
MPCRVLLVTLVTLAGVASRPAYGQTPQIDQLMSAAEFRQAGLAKLTPEELGNLSAWLAKYSRTLVQASSSSVVEGTTPATIESRIDGDFNGWEGETIFKLQNGQIWQQASYAYNYHYAYAPKVLIYRSGPGYMMRVDGIDRAIAVKRLK